MRGLRRCGGTRITLYSRACEGAAEYTAYSVPPSFASFASRAPPPIPLPPGWCEKHNSPPPKW
eukprot:2527323-Pleurochrysis_carterae.AAC.1